MTDEPGRERRSQRASVPFYRDVRVLAIISQVIVLLVVLLVGALLLNNMLSAMDQRGILPELRLPGPDAPASRSPRRSSPMTPSNTYARALSVGLLNTLWVSVVGIFLATVLGLIIGIARLSRNWLVGKLALGYVELFRNTPLLVQLFVIYFVVFLQLPACASRIVLPGSIYLSQRGLYTPRPELAENGAIWLTIVVVAIVVAGIGCGSSPAAATLRVDPPAACAGSPCWCSSGCPSVGWFVLAGDPVTFEEPELGKFNLTGGLKFTPEFAALTAGAGALHRGLHRRDHPRRHRGRQQGPARSRPGHRAQGGPDTAAGGPAAGPAHHHPAPHEPVPEPHQELQPGTGHRLRRPLQCEPHGLRADRPAGGGASSS